jgi:hypothetical protein
VLLPPDRFEPRDFENGLIKIKRRLSNTLSTRTEKRAAPLVTVDDSNRDEDGGDDAANNDTPRTKGRKAGAKSAVDTERLLKAKRLEKGDSEQVHRLPFHPWNEQHRRVLIQSSCS